MSTTQSPSIASGASSTVSVISERTRIIRAQYFFERRLLFCCTIMVAVAAVLWLISISTHYWFIIEGGSGIWINETKRYFLSSNSGLFKICRMAKRNATISGKATHNTTLGEGEEESPMIQANASEPRMILYRSCKYHEVFPNEAKVKKDPMLDLVILNYTRTEIMFSIISFGVMIMALFFSYYTFNNPRYMFKRLAGGIHFISCLSIFVVIEILMKSIEYEKEYLPVVHPPQASYYFGYSYFLAWTVLLLNFTAGVAFMWYSKKRKGDRAANEEIAMANEPTIIGR